MNELSNYNTLQDWFNDNLAESAKDISNHGCSGGFSGIIYYSETVAKYNKYQHEIWERLHQDANMLGCTVLEMIKNLGGSENVDTDHQFKNLLVWYYIEQLAHDRVNNE